MSAVPARVGSAVPAPSSPPVRERGVSLRAVENPARRRRPRLLYAIVAIVGAAIIGAAQMGLSIAMTQGGYEEQALRQQNKELTWEKQAVGEDIAGLSSPQYLAANAAALGMVINESPTYMRLSDGAILGAGSAASWESSVDALGRSNVANALVSEAPLVTEPDATIQGLPTPPVEAETGNAVPVDPALPPALSEGLPSPITR